MTKLGSLFVEFLGCLGVAMVAYMIHHTTVVFWTTFVVMLLFFVVLHLQVRRQAR